MSGGATLVYAGKGASHSWVWLADLLETNGVFNACFLDAAGLVRGLEDTPSLVAISGGDGFEIASALADRGFASLREFVHGGGRYVGVCAGAYLPLPSKIEPMSGFNISETRIRNVRSESAETADYSPRFSVRYGSCSVFHPIRGEVEIGNGTERFVAPIYGGPVFSEPQVDRSVLRYLSFTHRTSFQVEPHVAEQIMIDQPAVVTCDYGDGQLVLSGPHMEHPSYPRANECFLRLAGLSGRSQACCRSPDGTREPKSLDRSLADLKVAVLGMERESFLVGTKQWDGGRMLELAGAIENRKASLDNDAAQAVSVLLDRSREELMSAGPENVDDSDSAPALLVEAARLCVDHHFRAKRDEFILTHSH